tara:strand:+ start:14278 stop:14727 length:450 start_codon:yes stop_codon:yes gene_type:complete
MYGSLKRKNKRVNYLSYHPFGPNYENIIKEQDVKNINNEEPTMALAEDTSPLKLADNNPQTDAVIKSNVGNEKPIVLKPKVNNKDSENLPNKSYKNDSLFCIENMLLLLIFSMFVYCLYVYFTESKGRSSFGARECASYDISRAYDMVK